MQRSSRPLSLLALITACGGGGSHSPDAPALAPDAASNWADVSAHYGRLLDLAGAGATDNGGVEWMSSYEGGPATSAELSRPHIAMADGAGNVYIADKEANAIRKVTPAGIVTTVAGTGLVSPIDDTAGPATQRALGNPNGIYVEPDGSFYVLDLDHARIRRVDTTGTMTTLFTVQGGIPIGRGLWVEGAPGAETVYFAAGNVVRKWTSATGVVNWSTGYTNLGNLAMDAQGRLLVADRGGNRVYAVSEGDNGVVNKVAVAGNGSTGAGVDGAAAVTTPLEGVRAVWPAYGVDGGGFFAGTHEGCQLWFIDAAGIAHLFLDGEKDAHAGIGEVFSTPGKKLSELRQITLDSAGNVIIVDDDRGFVSKVERL